MSRGLKVWTFDVPENFLLPTVVFLVFFTSSEKNSRLKSIDVLKCNHCFLGNRDLIKQN